MIKTVLIVEDEPLVREYASAILEDEGFAVRHAPNAVEALRILKTESTAVSVLVTDVEMPGPLDGLTLAQIVDLSWPNISILVTSARTCSALDLPTGAKVLPKPWREVELASAVVSLQTAAP